MNSKLMKILNKLIIVVLLVLSGCNGDKDITTPSVSSLDISKLTPDCFTPYSNNPILTSGDQFTGSTWNDPHVLKIGNQYIMYASSDISFNHDIKIYRLISSDGVSWHRDPETAVFSAGLAGSWDEKSTETPSVVYYQNQYHLFYTGYKNTGSAAAPQDYRIGHAISNDGITWTRDSASPILAPTNVNLDFNQSVVAEPGAVVFNNKIYLYFTAIGANLGVGTTLQVIGLTIYDGSTWSTPQSVLEPDQTIYPRGDVDNGWYGYSTPSAIEIDNKIHLFFDVAKVEASTWSQRKLHHAYSNNGISNWNQDPNAIHSRDDFTWTETEIRSVTPYLDEFQLKIFFAGTKDFTLSIGLSVCDLSSN